MEQQLKLCRRDFAIAVSVNLIEGPAQLGNLIWGEVFHHSIDVMSTDSEPAERLVDLSLCPDGPQLGRRRHLV